MSTTEVSSPAVETIETTAATAEAAESAITEPPQTPKKIPKKIVIKKIAAPPKIKEVSVKHEERTSSSSLSPLPESESGEEVKVEISSPKTPKSVKTPKSSPKKRTTATTEANGESVEDSPTKKRKAAPKNISSKKIPTSVDELSQQDKMLIKMKDDGESWEKIREMWKTITGEEVGKSTLPNRYSRLKSNLSIFPEDDCKKLVQAKQEIEENFEKEKWNLIKACMEKNGVTNSYTTVALQKQFKKMATVCNKNDGHPTAVAGEDEASSSE